MPDSALCLDVQHGRTRRVWKGQTLMTVPADLSTWLAKLMCFTAILYWQKGRKAKAIRLTARLCWERLLWVLVPGYRQWTLERKALVISNWWHLTAREWWPRTWYVWFSMAEIP